MPFVLNAMTLRGLWTFNDHFASCCLRQFSWWPLICVLLRQNHWSSVLICCATAASLHIGHSRTVDTGGPGLTDLCLFSCPEYVFFLLLVAALCCYRAESCYIAWRGCGCCCMVLLNATVYWEIQGGQFGEKYLPCCAFACCLQISSCEFLPLPGYSLGSWTGEASPPQPIYSFSRWECDCTQYVLHIDSQRGLARGLLCNQLIFISTRKSLCIFAKQMFVLFIFSFCCCNPCS